MAAFLMSHQHLVIETSARWIEGNGNTMGTQFVGLTFQ
ncbi:predicted protein [Botrytis cinerea T4]|uniref:Uncharacterized protein n=1 Tax=Botryotinia fuckeliana (strain T4) TaxID=999810 RepID=G2YHY1_BOTF4|nr:predicted protein [Botrytis cinerea T4]